MVMVHSSYMLEGLAWLAATWPSFGGIWAYAHNLISCGPTSLWRSTWSCTLPSKDLTDTLLAALRKPLLEMLVWLDPHRESLSDWGL